MKLWWLIPGLLLVAFGRDVPESASLCNIPAGQRVELTGQVVENVLNGPGDNRLLIENEAGCQAEVRGIYAMPGETVRFRAVGSANGELSSPTGVKVQSHNQFISCPNWRQVKPERVELDLYMFEAEGRRVGLTEDQLWVVGSECSRLYLNYRDEWNIWRVVGFE